MCSFTWLGDDSQVKTAAFGKVISLIICKRQENERNYIMSRFFTNRYLPIRKKKILSVLSDSAVKYYLLIYTRMLAKLKK